MAKHALCVGINDYPGTGSDLSGCVNDANDWQAALAGRGYAVTMLLDANATRKNVLAALETLIASGKAGDSLVFTFSGHGSWIPDTGGDEIDQRDEMICPYDIMSNQYLLDDDLAEVFGRKAAGVSLFFISDSCHSGSVSRLAPVPAVVPGIPRPRILPPSVFVKDPKVAKQLDAVAGMADQLPTATQKYPALLLAGCRDLELSYDASFNGRANGAFTYYALQALGGNPATPRAWMKAVRESLPSVYYPQTPRLYGAVKAKDGVMP